MRNLRLFKYVILSSLGSFKVSWVLHALTVMTIGITFVVLAGGLLIFENLRSSLIGSRMESRISVYFQDENDSRAFRRVQMIYCEKSFVEKCVYRNSEEARTVFIEKNPDLKSAVMALPANPFPAGMEIEIQPDFRGVSVLQQFSKDLAAIPGVESVDDGGEWLVRWTELLNIFDRVMVLIGLILAFATVFIVANTIKLVVYARNDELEILHLVGASDKIIRAPFLLEGILQGAAGVLLAILFLRGIFEFGKNYFLIEWKGYLFASLVFLPSQIQMGLICLGMFLGFLGSFIAVNRFLRL